MAKLDKLISPLADELAKEKDTKGLPGTEILNFVRGLHGK